mgnify:FL=1
MQVFQRKRIEMLLKDLIKDLCLLPDQLKSIRIDTISCDSRQMQANGLFVALDGFKVKGESFIKQAIAQGAIVIAKKGASRHIDDYVIPPEICLLDVADPKKFLKDIQKLILKYVIL